MNLVRFTVNPFSENTYVLSDDTKDCIIIDPGCSTEDERSTLVDYIEASELKPVVLFNTHCHIDHILGNKFISEKYNLPLTSHREEAQVLAMQPVVSEMYGIPYEVSPEISLFKDQGDIVSFGETSLEVLFTPGHSPASISLYSKDAEILIAGDVLFHESIGRTDLPGGDMDTLISSIRKQFFTLPGSTRVFPGHGPETTVDHEKKNNPFLKSY